MEDQERILPIADLAASFQAAVVDVLVGKTLRAAREYKAKAILVAGGVSANRALRRELHRRSELPMHIPPIELCTDNAAMIAGAGYYRYIAGYRSSMDMDARPTWPVSELT
jgi:N6-L-threonylcarbamoyladenine synthase